MKILIAGGTGFIGRALIRQWLSQGWEITVLGRDKAKIHTCFGDQVSAVDWQTFNNNAPTVIAGYDLIVNLCGANIGAKRWTTARKQTILDSRITPAKAIATACTSLGTQAPRWFNASAVGIYGVQANINDQPFTEHSDLSAETSDFLSHVGRAWEDTANCAAAAGVSVVNLRFGVVLAKHGGALPKIAQPFYYCLGGTIGSGQQPFAWITLTDLCRAINFIIERKDLSGAINLVAPQIIQQQKFAHALGKALNRPSFMPMPAWVLKCLFGNMADELLLHGQQVMPQRLLQAGFQFHDADIDSALASIYSR